MNKNDWNLWGHLRPRYEQAGPRKMLSIDGGGLRGIIALEILATLEIMLKDKTQSGENFRLCHFFDYIAGTSTGAIIATALARGMSVGEIKTLYTNLATVIFSPASWSEYLQHRYSSRALKNVLKQAFVDADGKEATLEPQHLQTLLMVVVKNVSTDSPWPISSNPWGKYAHPERADCNLRIPLWQLVRASTAAPVYFPPEVIDLTPNDPDTRFVFADGSLTPYNNPAFQLFKMATLPYYNLHWITGEQNLLLVSVGTGNTPNVQPCERLAVEMPIWQSIPNVALSLLHSVQAEQDINCRAVGRCIYGPVIDDELGTMSELNQDTVPQFTYVRYDADLSLKSLLDLGLTQSQAENVRQIDKVSAINDLEMIGQLAAKAVDSLHFMSFL